MSNQSIRVNLQRTVIARPAKFHSTCFHRHPFPYRKSDNSKTSLHKVHRPTLKFVCARKGFLTSVYVSNTSPEMSRVIIVSRCGLIRLSDLVVKSGQLRTQNPYRIVSRIALVLYIQSRCILLHGKEPIHWVITIIKVRLTRTWAAATTRQAWMHTRFSAGCFNNHVKR